MPLLTGRGVHLPNRKEPAASRDVVALTDHRHVYVPISYEGNKGHCLLKPYAAVLRGQVIAAPETTDGAPIVSTVSGVFTEQRTIEHPLYGTLDCAVLDCMLSEESVPAAEPTNTDALSADAIIEAARKAAIVDEIDSAYLYDKLRVWREVGCDVLVGDGVEPEPYASAAWAVMNESIEQVRAGLQLAARVLASKGFGEPEQEIAVCLPAGRRRPLQQRLGDVPLYQVHGRYPVTAYVPRPLGKRVMRIGVQALLALYRAAAFGEAQTVAVVTVAGDAVATPQNVRVPFGTTVGTVLRHCGLSSEPQYLIMGDMMTGVALPDEEQLILAGTTCLLALTERPAPASTVCMGCGRCARVCHAGLLPYEIARELENMHYEHLARLRADECDGCGACSYVCPAGRDLTSLMAEAQRADDGSIFLNWGEQHDA